MNRVAPAHVVVMKPEPHASIDRPGHWLVTTASGTTHEIKDGESLYWRRTPAAGSGAASYDGRFVRLTRLGPIAVGSTFSLVVSDGSYLYGATIHRSAIVTQVQRLDGCRRCGYPAPLGFCWREAIEPGWLDSDREPGRRSAIRHDIERRLGRLRSARFNFFSDLRRFWARVRRGRN